jgi:hypothetical protein
MRSRLVVLFVLLLGAGAYAWHYSGCVYCDANGNGVLDDGDTPLAGVTLVVYKGGQVFGTVVTDSEGCFSLPLLDRKASYKVMIELPHGTAVISPADGVLDFSVDNNQDSYSQDWLLDCDHEPHFGCWLTGGGGKFCSITHSDLCTSGPEHSFGGNVFPSCDPDPGHGGQWNHVAHDLSLHFQGDVITEVECGNVDGIPEGSESPDTPVNFIEFKGTGTLKGIQGDKTDLDVHFFARCEDRNEPGSKGANDGALVDRYFLHVFTDPSDPAGSTVLLVDVDGDPTTVDPVTITGGNMQMHASSCDDPPDFGN